MVSRILLIRHGITEGNKKRWFYGGVDIPLLEEGREAISYMRENQVYPEIPEDAQCIISGLKRTKETMELIYGDRDVKELSNLREMSFGDYECKTYEELKEDADFVAWAYDETEELALPGGESRREFSERVSQGLKELVGLHRMKEWSHRHGGEDAVSVVVCHGGVISAMMQELFPDVNNNMWDWIPDPGLGYIVDWEGGEPVQYEKISDIKKLGFGFMRLPMKDDTSAMDQVKAMVDHFMEKGYNYFDTAWGYHGGMSEVAIREALVERYPRDRFYLATKLPAFSAKDEESAKAMFETSLERCGVDYFDYYLLHNLGVDRTHLYEDYHLWDYLKDLKMKGKVRQIGFSMHDTSDVLDEILAKHGEDIDFVQLQINYADWDNPMVESRLCYEVARKYNKPVIIMEPVKGGNLAELPPQVAEIFQEADPKRSMPSWALQFAMSLPGVITVLSGMSTLEQVRENVAVAEAFQPMTEEEQKTIELARKTLSEIPHIPCTFCRYCTKGCPVDIPIPGIFNSMNRRMLYGDAKGSALNYSFATMRSGKASDCVACGQCEGVCPQQISIIKELKQAAEWYDGE